MSADTTQLLLGWLTGSVIFLAFVLFKDRDRR